MAGVEDMSPPAGPAERPRARTALLQAAAAIPLGIVKPLLERREEGPRGPLDGVGLLSDRPLTLIDDFDSPEGLEAVVATPAGPITVIVAHPAHSPIEAVDPVSLVVGYDVSDRDADLARLRARIDAVIGRGERVMLLGDMNTTPTEPGFATLVAGLRDAHAEVGLEPGWTLRPQALVPFDFGVLRIDVVVTSPDLPPIGSHEVCLPVSDHCQLWATVAGS